MLGIYGGCGGEKEMRMRFIAEQLSPAGMLRIAPRWFHLKYILVCRLPGQGGDKPKLYCLRYGTPLFAHERRFGDAGRANRANVAQPDHPEVHAPAQKRFRRTPRPP